MPTVTPTKGPKADQGIAQIHKNLYAELEKEKEAILKLCSAYQQNKDEKIADKINELNLHMHAKISILSENMKPVDAKELEKLQNEANKGVEAAAKTHSMKVDYVDIRNINVTANGVTKKLHMHLNDVLEKASDAQSFVSLLPTQVNKALTKINLDKELLLNGDSELFLKGLLELNELRRSSEVVSNPEREDKGRLHELSNQEKVKLNDILKNADDEKLVGSIVNSSDMNSALTKDTVKELLINKNPRISKMVSESPVIKLLGQDDILTLLNKGTIDKKAVSPGVIEGVFSNPDIINTIGESQFKKKNISGPRTQEKIEELAAQKIFSIFKSASEGKVSKLAGGKYSAEAINGLAKNKKTIEILVKNNHDIFKLFNDAVQKFNSPSSNSNFIRFNANSFINGLKGSEMFWSSINSNQLDSTLKIPSLRKFVSETPMAAKNLNRMQAIELFTNNMSNELVTMNHELLNKIPESSLSVLLSNPTLNKVGLAQNKFLDKINETYLDVNSSNFLFRTTNPFFISNNVDLFGPNSNLSEKLKRRLANQFILANFNEKTAPSQIDNNLFNAFLNPELIKYITKSKVMVFLNKYDVANYISGNPALLNVLSKSNINSLIAPGSNFSKFENTLSLLMSNESVIKKLGTDKLNQFITDYLDVNKRTKELESIITGLIKNKGVVFNYDELSMYIKTPNTKMVEAIVSRNGVEEILSDNDIIYLFNNTTPRIRNLAMLNIGLFRKFLSL